MAEERFEVIAEPMAHVGVRGAKSNEEGMGYMKKDAKGHFVAYISINVDAAEKAGWPVKAGEVRIKMAKRGADLLFFKDPGGTSSSTRTGPTGSPA